MVYETTGKFIPERLFSAILSIASITYNSEPRNSDITC